MGQVKRMMLNEDGQPRVPSGVWGEEEIVTEHEGLDAFVSYRRTDGTHVAHALITEQQFATFSAAVETENGAALVERIEPVIEPDGTVREWIGYWRSGGEMVAVREATVIRVLRAVAARSRAWVEAFERERSARAVLAVARDAVREAGGLAA